MVTLTGKMRVYADCPGKQKTAKIAVVALPVGIITAGYMKAIEEPNEIVTKESKDVGAGL